MLRVIVLALALPAMALADGHQMEMDMMQMMQMMNQMKGWGPMQPAPQQHWSEAKSMEDYEAYLKWCNENKMRQAEQEKQMALLAEYRAKEAARAEEAKKAALAAAEEEAKENYMLQWKHWERQLEHVADLGPLQLAIENMKMKYYKRVMFSFLTLCKCNDYAMDISRFFDDEGLIAKYKGEIMDVSDLLPSLTPAQLLDARAVAQAIANTGSMAEGVKVFFGGLREAMCEGAKEYYDQAVAWDKEYDFLDNLLPTI